ncbi:MAG: RsmB/NOP family class I SAM-dependent RNA methyltransferase [Clostridia bacterium]|nr:RsmB/NOP family class I SAM-dependent RNA methyltransferase [Clostridia bacterium]
MLSVLEVKRKLPQAFVDNLYELFSPLTVDKILSGMVGERYTTLRVNTLKYDIQSLMRYFKEKNVKFERVPWYQDALIIKNVTEKEIQKLDIFEKGYIYLQSLSSMVPPLVLNPKLGEKVLDLTAAPGSKTTQMAAIMQNTGSILANELDKIRCERLQYNVTAQGASIVTVNNDYGERIGGKYPEAFDKVLLDTPCSGEGRFLATESRTYRNWSERKVSELVKMQKRLFKSAYEALMPNGIMVYSTCTLNLAENEQILEWALEQFNLKLLNIELELREIQQGQTESTKQAVKILPSKNMEGFFVAKLKKVNK